MAPRLDAVVKEVMRLTPPVGGFFRRTQAPIQLAGCEVSADRVVQVSFAATHRHGNPADDLEVFRPQRHLETAARPCSCPLAAVTGSA